MMEMGSLPWPVVAARLGAALLAGLLLGLNREVRGKSAGLRTHALAALSSAALTLVALELDAAARGGDTGGGGSGNGGGDSDPIRVIQGVAQAMGLIAAGLVIQGHGNRVRNLTTAVGVWTASAVGIACGAGFLLIAGLTTLLTLLALLVLGGVETRFFDSREDEPPRGRPQP